MTYNLGFYKIQIQGIMSKETMFINNHSRRLSV